MKKSYILAYNDTLGTREIVKKAIDDSKLIITWRYDMPNMFYLISEYEAKEIATELRKMLPEGRFIVLEHTDNSHGWLDSKSWYLLQNKSHEPTT